MAPRQARYVRLSHLGGTPPGEHWSIAELFAYEAATTPWAPPDTAVTALEAARRELAHGADDPTGPHPKRAPVTYAHRRAQGRVGTGVRGGERGDAAGARVGGGSPCLRPGAGAGELVEGLGRAGRRGPRRPGLAGDASLGRAGRRAETRVVALGRDAEAEALRAEAERRAAPAFHVRFGHDLELVRVEVAGRRLTGEHGHRAVRVTGSPPGGRDLHGPRPRRPARRTRGLRAGSSDGRRLRHRQGETVEETVELRVPADAPPGPYQIRAAVWDPARARHLPVRGVRSTAPAPNGDGGRPDSALTGSGPGRRCRRSADGFGRQVPTRTGLRRLRR